MKGEQDDMLAEGQLISRLSGSSVIFLSNNSVALIKEVNSNSSSDTNTGTEQSAGQEVSKMESDNTSSQAADTASGESTAAGDTAVGADKVTAEVTQAASDTNSETIQHKAIAAAGDTQNTNETGDTGTESGAEVSTTPAPDTEKPQTEGAAGGDNVVMEGDTGMVQSSGAVAADPAMAEGTQSDPAMQAGMAGGKGTLLSSWPFVGGISIAVILVSIAIGTFLARRKIKKGIEIYED